MDYRSSFSADCFRRENVDRTRRAYQFSFPYKHVVVSNLINDSLLHAVREEVSNLSFSRKETDIYRIWQSGDLKNLDDAETARQLPALFQLRNALYSEPFRSYLSEVTGAGALSASKVDIAANVYTPGCYLLPHDDVIGSRRVSFILYFTDPEVAWQTDWGGNLRLYPVEPFQKSNDSKVAMVPAPEPLAMLRIGWNKMALFAVQPGQSFHDVEEVYSTGTLAGDMHRIRPAISGWFHIPQEGETGYRQGEAQEHEVNSGRLQLSNTQDHEYPKPGMKPYAQSLTVAEQLRLRRRPNNPYDLTSTLTPELLPYLPIKDFDVQDMDLLLKYINYRWLVPDTVMLMRKRFDRQCYLQVDDFLNDKYANSLQDALRATERSDRPWARSADLREWKVASPPHKQKYLYMLPKEEAAALASAGERPAYRSDDLRSTPPTPSHEHLQELMTKLFPSLAFRKWLHAVTEQVLSSYDVRARRFRQGSDYQLAKPYNEEAPRLEVILALSPDGKWGNNEENFRRIQKEELSRTDVNGNDAGSESVHPGDQLEASDSAESNAEPGKKRGKGEPRMQARGVTARDSQASHATKRRRTNEQSPKPMFSKLVEHDWFDVSYGGYEVWMASDEDPDMTYPNTEREGRSAATMEESGTKDDETGESNSEHGTSEATASSDGVAFDEDASTPRSPPSASEATRKLRPKPSTSDPAVYQDAADPNEDSTLCTMANGWNRLNLVIRDQHTLRFVKYVGRSAGADRWDLVGEYGINQVQTDAEETVTDMERGG